METFSASLPICAGKSPVTDEFPAQTNGWENCRKAGDLRRHHTHYDITVISNSLLINQVIDTSVLCQSCVCDNKQLR